MIMMLVLLITVIAHLVAIMRKLIVMIMMLVLLIPVTPKLVALIPKYHVMIMINAPQIIALVLLVVIIYL
jgi:hypothetical protein